MSRSAVELTRLLALAIGAAASSSCAATLSADDLVRVPSEALEPASDSALGQVFRAPVEGAESRFAPLDRGDEGLDARLALATVAESSIDAQTYIWHEDGCGSLLLDRLFAAADRGVRVRLLSDGFKLEAHEDFDKALDLHPNVEIRVFNPTLHRSGVWQRVEVLENLERLDHRMHNKLFLVDGVAAVFGGRNVGDEYFGLGEEADMRDFDLLASGPVVADLATSFDEFWNGPWTVPLAGLVTLPGDGQGAHARAREKLRSMASADGRLDGRRALGSEDWRAALERAERSMVPGRAQVIHDSAEIERDGAAGILARGFEAALEGAHGEVLVVTAYLVPDETFLEEVRRHVARGERVRILTNSYASTNQPLVHTYYAPLRRALLEAGAELHEVRGDAWSHVRHRSPGSEARKLGLHAKSAVFGADHVLVGSMNLDPRSMELNTELGVLIESAPLAEWVRGCLERGLEARNAWRVDLHEDGGLRWSTQGLELREEPAMGSGEHAREWFLRLLPLEGEV